MSRKKGNIAEQAVVEQLKKQGFSVVARNVTSRFGEIDIICCKEDILAVIEVKARKSFDYGHPGEWVNTKKQQNIILCLKHFLNCHPIWHTKAIRFDVACVTLTHPMNIDIIEAAFEHH